MTPGELWARFANIDSLKPICRNATPILLRFRPFVVHIDVPENGALENSASVVQGWFLAPMHVREFCLQLAGIPLRLVEVERKDAQRVFGLYAHGFRAIVDMDAVAIASAGHAGTANLELVFNGRVVASKPLRLLNCDAKAAKASARKRAEKREWLKSRLACPACDSRRCRLEFLDLEIRCVCGASFEQSRALFNFLPERFKREFNISDWEDISAHAYDDVAKEVIEEARTKGGKVLDCGSGLRAEVDETVICLEVEAFPNVDVLGVNQKLPFQDAIFDAVLSLNVLEHVTDPFACADELVRVLKPGGTLYCCIPFLQPEHGYPDHYFNATRSGLRRIFARHLEMLRHFVPGSGQPVWTLHWFLSWYLRELPPAQRAEFLNLRVQDIIANPAQALLQKPWVTHLSDRGKWTLASSTAALFTKPALTG